MNTKMKPTRPPAVDTEAAAARFIAGGSAPVPVAAPAERSALPKKGVYNLSLWPDVMDRLQALADARRVSRSQLVSEALEQYLEREAGNA